MRLEQGRRTFHFAKSSNTNGLPKAVTAHADRDRVAAHRSCNRMPVALTLSPALTKRLQSSSRRTSTYAP